ncbi:signal transduction histidine kinase [Exiguobacterium sp. PvP048]|uniref:histidine kinase n=1 Tax=Exiguobacterium sibiricum (strain DSM 17290 / CCUG 55495 / CIP 109462 / JCM 13490 / 255-15) TaxID=262543 RepID=B1YHZ3_EXIS2|nr:MULTISPECIES: HAMP domain-containing sensor histidine kinase [Exiguobacterium]ACB59777.1 histidine kinase [Exiguobacterium sibiricum 255-15]MCT4793755.1 HAMP domain-containing histidine kinase [Exiguobacterium artemiae]
MFDFLKEAIQSPKTIGAIAPSSPRLAQMMAQRAVADHPDVIIEVGAGDGAITQALLRARHPETTYRYAGPAHLSVQAAPNLLRRLIENLVRNATLHGTGDLSFEVLQESGHLTFRCSNAIPETLTPHQLTELATPFVTSDMSRSNGGSGIGLSIIEQIVARHNGTMQLTSEQNRFIVSVVLPDAYKEG